MNILIATDSFKEALPADAVCQAIARGIRAVQPTANIQICPLADGGEGTYNVLASALGLQKIEKPTSDPLFRSIKASYGLSEDGEMAFVEMASCAGLQLLESADRNPLFTTTFGVGELISDALERDVKQIILAIGGSATNDAGIGMAAALGWKFLDQTGASLMPIGQHLHLIETIIPPQNEQKVRVKVICDVTNPLFGPDGAAYVYARQKGADAAAIEHLDAGLRHLAEKIAETLPSAPNPMEPGAGAAGGMGFGARCFLNAELKRGAEIVMELLQMDEKLRWADIVVTGEGKVDSQTASGKLVQGLCSRAANYNTPVIAFCGRLEASEAQIKAIGLQAAYEINDPDNRPSLAIMLENTAVNLEKTAARVFVVP